MTYAADSPLKGQGTATAAQILAWLQSHAQDGANYVRLPIALLPPGLGQAIIDACTATGINADLVAAQIAHESSYAQSDFARNRCNYSGMGAINADPGLALTFPTPRAGVRAQVAHLLTYTDGASNPWKADDPRYSATVGSDMFGKARTLHDLDQHWAWSPQAEYDAAPASQRYGAMIASLANSLVSFASQQGGTPAVSVTDFSGVPLSWEPAAEGNYDTSRGTVRLYIVHDEEASTAASAVSRFQTAGQQASAHFVVDPANGTIRQCVSTAHTAYACGNYALNQVSVSTEMPGFMGKPYDPRCVDYQARCAAYCVQKFGLPIVRLTKQQVAAGAAGFCGHEDVPDPDHPGQWGGSDHHGDPGATFPWDQFLSLVRQYAGGSAQPQVVTPPTPVQPAPDPMRRFAETGFGIAHGFRVFWESYGDKALATFGYPISWEFQEGGLTVQYFERARFEYHPENQPPYDILLSRLGDAAAVAAVKQANPDAFKPQQ